MKKILGQPTINPIVFFSGKVSGYITWIFFFIQFFYKLNHIKTYFIVEIISYIFFSIGLFITILSLFNLGSSTTLGIPQKETTLKSNGLYKISRNPMYLGFNLISLSAVIHTLNYFVLALFVYSMIVYHIIILKEEIFLKKRFGEKYLTYYKTVRRYI